MLVEACQRIMSQKHCRIVMDDVLSIVCYANCINERIPEELGKVPFLLNGISTPCEQTGLLTHTLQGR